MELDAWGLLVPIFASLALISRSSWLEFGDIYAKILALPINEENILCTPLDKFAANLCCTAFPRLGRHLPVEGGEGGSEWIPVT